MKFNLFSMIHDKKVQKKGPNIALSNLDLSLFLLAFSAIFGILHFRLFTQELKVSLGGLVLTLLFCAFWVGMAFTGGRYRRKGFWLTAAIIWGLSLLCCLANLTSFSFLQNLSGTFAGKIAAVTAFLFLLFVAATVAPLLPGLAFFGIVSQTAESLVLLCVISILVIASAYLVGFLFQRRRETESALARADILRKQNLSPSSHENRD